MKFSSIGSQEGDNNSSKIFIFFFGQMQAIYQSRRVPNNLLIVGTFSEALVTLASPPFPPQTKLNSEPNRLK